MQKRVPDQPMSDETTTPDFENVAPTPTVPLESSAEPAPDPAVDSPETPPSSPTPTKAPTAEDRIAELTGAIKAAFEKLTPSVFPPSQTAPPTKKRARKTQSEPIPEVKKSRTAKSVAPAAAGASAKTKIVKPVKKAIVPAPKIAKAAKPAKPAKPAARPAAPSKASAQTNVSKPVKVKAAPAEKEPKVKKTATGERTEPFVRSKPQSSGNQRYVSVTPQQKHLDTLYGSIFGR